MWRVSSAIYISFRLPDDAHGTLRVVKSFEYQLSEKPAVVPLQHWCAFSSDQPVRLRPGSGTPPQN
jgi:hypothetical protein